MKYFERTMNSRQKSRYPTRKHSPQDESPPNHLPYKLLVFYVCWLTFLVLLNLFEKSVLNIFMQLLYTFYSVLNVSTKIMSSNFKYLTLSSLSPLKWLVVSSNSMSKALIGFLFWRVIWFWLYTTLNGLWLVVWLANRLYENSTWVRRITQKIT